MTLATRLTMSRLCLSPLVFLLFWIDKIYSDSNHTFFISIALLAIATYSEISDAIDGRIARKRNEVTDFGKLFDPFTDSVYRFTFFFGFWWKDLCPAWMVVLIFYRETAVSFLRLVLRGENVVLAARRSGKIKAIFQAVAIFLIVIAQGAWTQVPAIPLQEVSTTVMFAVVVMTMISLVDYVSSHWPILAQIKK
jgi:CDP-diacylglycerol---glycerol-3-phosphate 3-phosphatidyltransferase